MMRQVLIAAIGVFVILAAAWLASIVAERRRRALQGRLAAVLAPSPATSSLSQTEVASVLRREAASRGTRVFPLVPLRFRQWLVAELQATGDSLGITSLLIAAAVGTLVTTGVL